MCDFFSFVWRGNKYYYFDWNQRKKIIKKRLLNAIGQPIDSPDSHSEICAFYNLNCDKVNKYEYNPLTKDFKIDQINIKDNSIQAEKWIKNINFGLIVKPLILKPIINPFKDVKFEGEITPKIIELLKKWSAVWDAVGAYISSFFKIKYKYDFSPCVKLWEMGLVPSFNGKTWRLHAGEKATIVYEMKKEDL